MYASQDIPGSQSFRVTSHESLTWCTESLRKLAKALDTDNVSATLYMFSGPAWDKAREFERIGCPFDYPAKVINRGPRGGFRVVDA
jgi:hypothetical protein